jgi:DNA-binding transcriptional ArsR family regulator
MEAGAMGDEIDGTWTFLTNHAHVLICLQLDPSLRVRDLADRVGITERAAHRILTDLIRSGYLTRERDGRRNHYRLHLDRPMRHPLERSVPVRDLLVAVSSGDSRGLGFDAGADTDA